jgi:hypothetical protein
MKYFLIPFFISALIAGLILSGYFLAVVVVLLAAIVLGSYIGVAIYFYNLGQENLKTGADLAMQAGRINDEMDVAKINATSHLLNSAMKAIKINGGMVEDNTKYLLPAPDEIKFSPFVVEHDN